MSYIPGFDHDIFISYARANDIPYEENLPGWVTEFCVTLEKVLLANLNREDNLNPKDLSIWMDTRNINGNEFWDDAIEKAAQKSAVMITVLSDPYLQSRYCMQEIDIFSRNSQFQINVGGISRNRIFKVIIDSIPANKHPQQIRLNNGYEFFSVDPFSKKVSQMMKMDKAFPNPDYRDLIETLAEDLKNVFNEMLKKPEEHSSAKDAKVVYLAEVPDELADERDAIRNELSQRNIIVLPTQGLSNISQDVSQDIENYLKRSEFYIHLLGANYKRVSMNDNSSLTKIQHEIADKVSQIKSVDENQKNLKRIVWIKPNLDISSIPNQLHREFVESLVSTDNADSPMEVIREPSIEILKDIIVKKIIPTVTKKPKILEKSSQIFISHIPEDEKEAKIIADILAARNHTVFQSLNSKDKKISKDDDLFQLRGCDAVVVLYGNDREGSRFEVRRKLGKVNQIAKSRKNRPIKARSLCDGPPDPKEPLGVSLNKNEWIEIVCRNGLDPVVFEKFYDALAND